MLPGGLIDHTENFEDACLREIYEEIGLKAVSYDSKNALFKLGTESIGSLFYPYYLYESVTKNIQEIDDHQNEKFPPKSQHLILFFMIKFDRSYHQLPLNFNPDEVEEAAWVSLPQLK